MDLGEVLLLVPLCPGQLGAELPFALVPICPEGQIEASFGTFGGRFLRPFEKVALRQLWCRPAGSLFEQLVPVRPDAAQELFEDVCG